MKKLMFALAAVAATVAMADVTSANIVGYKGNALRYGSTFIAPTFVDVGEEEDGCDITKFKTSGDFVSGEIQICQLDRVGRDITHYSWSQNLMTQQWGWKDEDEDMWLEKGDVVFSPIDGLSVDGDLGYGLVISGEVSTKARTIPLRYGLTFTGNMTAAPLDVTTIVPEGDYSSGEIQICQLDRVGRDITHYSWSQNLMTQQWGWKDEDEDQWLDDGDVLIPAGEGFSVDGDIDYSITIPGLKL